MRGLQRIPENEAVTHKLTTVQRHVVTIDVPRVKASAETVYELRFGHAELELDKPNLSHLIRTLIAVRAGTDPDFQGTRTERLDTSKPNLSQTKQTALGGGTGWDGCL